MGALSLAGKGSIPTLHEHMPGRNTVLQSCIAKSSSHVALKLGEQATVACYTSWVDFISDESLNQIRF